MKLLLILSLTLVNLFSANILSFKVYDRSDRTDLLLTFDTPYNGRISQKDSLNKTTLLLYDALYSQQVQKSVQSAFINSFSLVPQNNRTALVLTLAHDSAFKVSKTVDNYGLRLRFFKKNAASKALSQTPSTLSRTSQLPTKDETLSNDRYIIVVVILFIAVILLFFIKRKVEKNRGSGGWLFKNQPQMGEQFNILFQKPIDNLNKVVLIEVNDKQYLVVLGSSHLLLDTFSDKNNISQDGFESILQDNQQELDQYMQIDKRDAKSDPLQSYKEKASLEAYRSHM